VNNYIDIKRVDTGAEVVTLAEVKEHLGLTDSDNDSKLTALIAQCRKAVENYCSISITQKTVTMTADLSIEWELPYGPVTGITAVKVRATAEGSGIASYETLEEGWESDGEEFASFLGGPETRYRITYTTGYSSVPEDLKLGVLNEIYYRYEHRGNEIDTHGLSQETINLVQPYKRMPWM
jgi:hypothetical protein